jgi:hypothetical protein
MINLKEAITNKIDGIGISSGEFLVNLIIAIFIIIIGIIIGKIVKLGLRKLLEKIKLYKILKKNIVDLFLRVIKWSIYILFINLAIMQLGIPQITENITNILGVIPSLTGALVIISLGFAIGVFLKNIVIESKVEGGEILSQIFFFFINYIFIIFAIKTALISIKDVLITNILIVIITTLGGISLMIFYFRNKHI